MPITDTSMYRQRADIVADMIAQLVAAIPDAHTSDDGVISIVFEIEAGQLENLYLAHQILLEDMFIQTASLDALLRYGDQYGLSMKVGTQSTGTLLFSGDANTYVPIGTEVAYDPGGGLEIVYFQTTTDGTIPNPGIPTVPTVAVNVTAGNLNGMYEYMVSFVNAVGEGLPSPFSAAVNPANQQVNLTAIPLGGPGVTARNIYRDKNGAGTPRLIATIANNTATTYTDNITDAVMNSGSQPQTVDGSLQVSVQGQAEDPGANGNVATNTITELTNAPAPMVGVTNTTAFTGGEDAEDIEAFRTRLLQFIRNPQTGSADDLVAWAEAVDGVDSATVFPNTPAAGQVTVRIVGPGGTVPSPTIVANAQAALQEQDLANIVIIVSTFTPVVTNVTVKVLPAGTFTLADVTASVQTAVTNYINGLPAGGTLFISGLIDSVFGLPGIADVSITAPTGNVTTAAASKQTAGTVTVTL